MSSVTPRGPGAVPGAIAQVHLYIYNIKIEIDPLHLAVGDPVKARAKLVVEAYRTASSRSTGPKRSCCCFASVMNFSYQPGNDQLSMPAAAIMSATILAHVWYTLDGGLLLGRRRNERSGNERTSTRRCDADEEKLSGTKKRIRTARWRWHDFLL